MASRKISTREAVLAVILVSAMIWAYWYLTGRAMDGSADSAAEDGAGAFQAENTPRVRIDLLAGLAEPYNQGGRDLFKYAKRPPTAEELEAERLRRLAEEEARRKALEASRLAREKKQNKARPATPTRTTGPRPPRISFTYIGNFGPQDDRIAVFEQGEEVFVARIGETVQDDFRVQEIEYETVVIGYTDPRFAKVTKTLNQTR